MKRFLIVFLVALLIMPATALAVGKPDFAASKSAESKSMGKALGITHSGGDTPTAGEGSDNATSTAKGGVQASNNSHAREKQANAQKGIEKANDHARLALIKRDEKKAEKKLHVEDTATPQDSTATVHRGGGISTAIEKIQRNITRMGEKASAALDEVSTALQTVVDKFEAWVKSMEQTN